MLVQPEVFPITLKSMQQLIHVAGNRTPSEQRIFLLPSVNLDYYNKHGLFESNLIEWSRQFCKKDRIFLDIGAHTGTYSIALASDCQKVVAFEPQKNTYYALCGGVALSGLSDKVTCIQTGLGSHQQVGTQTLNIVSNDGGGSTLHFDDSDASKLLRTETIQIQTLDGLNLENVGFIKMDVEGNELDVLQGGLETIRNSNFPPILLEINTQAEFEKLKTFLQETVGYRDLIRVSGTQNMALAVM